MEDSKSRKLGKMQIAMCVYVLMIDDKTFGWNEGEMLFSPGQIVTY